MLRFRIAGALMMIAGVVSLFSGIGETAVAAVECSGGTYYEATICYPAFAQHRNDSLRANMSCAGDQQNCDPTANSQCGTLEGFQVAVRGTCGATLNNSEPPGCTEDSVSTFVALDYFTSKCEFKNGVCQCILFASAIHPTQYSEVCDCIQ